MNEEIKKYKISLEEQKEYIEMWIHEVKIPVSSIMLMIYKKDEISKVLKPIKTIDNLVEQVLYYARIVLIYGGYFLISYHSSKNIIK